MKALVFAALLSSSVCSAEPMELCFEQFPGRQLKLGLTQVVSSPAPVYSAAGAVFYNARISPVQGVVINHYDGSWRISTDTAGYLKFTSNWEPVGNPWYPCN